MLRIDEKKRTGRGGVEFGDQRAKRNRFFFLTRHRANLLNAKASMVPPTSRVKSQGDDNDDIKHLPPAMVGKCSRISVGDGYNTIFGSHCRGSSSF